MLQYQVHALIVKKDRMTPAFSQRLSIGLVLRPVNIKMPGLRMFNQ